MKISRREDFGLLLMATLAKNYEVRLVSLAEVAVSYHISPFFLKHLAAALKKKGLIKSKEGVKGGYMLTRSPTEITVVEIITALSGGVIILPCSRKGNACKVGAHCRAAAFWDTFNQKLIAGLSRINLSDFANGSSYRP